MSKNVPKVRFDGFSGDWEERILGAISEKISEKNKDNLYSETFTNSAEFGIITQRDFFEKDISNKKNLDGYFIIRPDDFVYNPRISNRAPVGPIKRNTLGRTGVMSPLYYAFRVFDIDKSYLEVYFHSSYWYKFMKLNGDSGARADRFAIKDTVFRKMPIPYPLLSEQQKIGAFFKNLDDIIALQQQLVEQQQQYKKAMLQKMFPQKGDRVPKVRFNGFSGNWEETRLSSLFESRNIKQIPTTEAPLMAFTSTGGVEEKGERFNREFLVKDENKTYKRTELNDLIYSSNNLDVGAIGRNKYGTAVISDVYEIFQTRNSTTPEFSEIIIKQKTFLNKVLKYRQGALYGQYRIYASDFLSVNILIPSLKEQKKIGDFFQVIDRTIALHEKKLEDFQKLKKALLYYMFV
ncbi:restriction endonuclease subunit S [Bacillus tropicus]|uniref:restriction endonuclease subunit S n=1 Tax=Bacillus cereus group TaxID=86661 RepID=UPI000CD9CD79|nr:MULTISPECIES: restriction endonuclease subunit S [Bacillus cereus group]MCC2339465.1 restriction endonuclease subunit S [Bacillus tropicus]MCU5422709.1 restriction endonuclease subunit S [Bacillus tropicus]